jgi:hypothetical protein
MDNSSSNRRGKSRNNRKATARSGPASKPKFCRFITLRNGRVLDAYDYGYKAWPIYRK